MNDIGFWGITMVSLAISSFALGFAIATFLCGG